ncbi:hypothetical protein K474DRAFT_813410 [Panus rudis PR-1116 ss-1]|nr:hypothetical protein K474DRAFT_813410 [Panus rudis PR-1116 ss-1]
MPLKRSLSKILQTFSRPRQRRSVNHVPRPIPSQRVLAVFRRVPDDAWELICLYLELEDIKNLTLTCHCLRECVQPHLFHQVSITFRGSVDADNARLAFISWFRTAQGVRTLSLCGSELQTRRIAFFEDLTIFRNVTSVALQRLSVGSYHLERLASLPKLDTLSFDKCIVYGAPLVVPRMRLRRLAFLDRLVREGDRSGETLDSGIWWMPLVHPDSLQELRIEVDHLQSGYPLLATQSPYRHLRILTLPDNAPEQEGYADFLANCPALEELKFKVELYSGPESEPGDVVPDPSSLPPLQLPNGALPNLRLIMGGPRHVMLHAKGRMIRSVRLSPVFGRESAVQMARILPRYCPRLEELVMNVDNLSDKVHHFLHMLFGEQPRLLFLRHLQVTLYDSDAHQAWVNKDIADVSDFPMSSRSLQCSQRANTALSCRFYGRCWTPSYPSPCTQSISSTNRYAVPTGGETHPIMSTRLQTYIIHDWRYSDKNVLISRKS